MTSCSVAPYGRSAGHLTAVFPLPPIPRDPMPATFGGQSMRFFPSFGGGNACGFRFLPKFCQSGEENSDTGRLRAKAHCIAVVEHRIRTAPIWSRYNGGARGPNLARVLTGVVMNRTAIQLVGLWSLLLLGAAGAQADEPKKIALLIGVENY